MTPLARRCLTCKEIVFASEVGQLMEHLRHHGFRPEFVAIDQLFEVEKEEPMTPISTDYFKEKKPYPFWYVVGAIVLGSTILVVGVYAYLVWLP